MKVGGYLFINILFILNCILACVKAEKGKSKTNSIKARQLQSYSAPGTVLKEPNNYSTTTMGYKLSGSSANIGGASVVGMRSADSKAYGISSDYSSQHGAAAAAHNLIYYKPYSYSSKPKQRWCPYGRNDIRCTIRQDGDLNFEGNDYDNFDGDGGIDAGGLGGLAGLFGLLGLTGLGPLALLKAPLILPALLPALAPLLLPLLLPILLLLPLLVLFLPIPVITIPQGRTLSPSSSMKFPGVSRFAANILGSEECVERISCEIVSTARVYKKENWVKSFLEYFPKKNNKWLKRVVRGVHGDSSTDSYNCSRFACKPVAFISKGLRK